MTAYNPEDTINNNLKKIQNIETVIEKICTYDNRYEDVLKQYFSVGYNYGNKILDYKNYKDCYLDKNAKNPYNKDDIVTIILLGKPPYSECLNAIYNNIAGMLQAIGKEPISNLSHAKSDLDENSDIKFTNVKNTTYIKLNCLIINSVLEYIEKEKENKSKINVVEENGIYFHTIKISPENSSITVSNFTSSEPNCVFYPKPRDLVTLTSAPSNPTKNLPQKT